MSLEGLMTRDVSIVRAAITSDRYHNAVANWSSTTITAVKGWLSQAFAEEPGADGRAAEITSWDLYLPADTDIVATDRVLVDGVTFEVLGAPNRARRPSGEHHVEAKLRKVDG